MIEQAFNIATYRKHVAHHRLMASKCQTCNQMYLPPRAICPKCHCQKMKWAQLQGHGTIIGFTSIAVVSTTMSIMGFGRNNPYISAVIKMAEGPIVTARVQMSVNDGSSQVQVGMEVDANFVEESIGDMKRIMLVFSLVVPDETLDNLVES